MSFFVPSFAGQRMRIRAYWILLAVTAVGIDSFAQEFPLVYESRPDVVA